MPRVRIDVEASSAVDPWARLHGLAIDQDLPSEFWNVAPEKIIGVNPAGSPRFSYSAEYDLTPGRHRVTYGNSASSRTPWTGRVSVDGRVVAEGRVDRDHFISGEFEVAVVPPIPWYWWLLAGLGALGLVVVGYSIVSAEVRKR